MDLTCVLTSSWVQMQKIACFYIFTMFTLLTLCNYLLTKVLLTSLCEEIGCSWDTGGGRGGKREEREREMQARAAKKSFF